MHNYSGVLVVVGSLCLTINAGAGVVSGGRSFVFACEKAVPQRSEFAEGPY